MPLKYAKEEDFSSSAKVDIIACVDLNDPLSLQERVGFPPLVADDIMPGLGVLEGYSCWTEEGTLFSIIRKPDDTLLNIYAASIESLPVILKELGLEDSDVSWRCTDT